MKAKVPVSRGQPCESIETRKAVKVQQRLSSLWLESNNRLLSTSSPPDPSKLCQSQYVGDSKLDYVASSESPRPRVSNHAVMHGLA